MHHSFAQKLGKIGDLVESGKLPKEAIPRLCYFGHTYKGTLLPAVYKLKCVSCDHEWENEHLDFRCPECKGTDSVYDITPQIPIWECIDCSHEWKGEDGTVCPSCKSVKKD
jgi:rubrerythrin